MARVPLTLTARAASNGRSEAHGGAAVQERAARIDDLFAVGIGKTKTRLIKRAGKYGNARLK